MATANATVDRHRHGRRPAGGRTPASARIRVSKSTTDRRRPKQLAAAEPGEFDVVTCLEMLEHVPDPSQVVRSCAELVKPGGHVFFSTINRNPKVVPVCDRWRRVRSEAAARRARTSTRNSFGRPSSKPGRGMPACELRDSIGMHYNPLTKSTRSGPNLDVNYLMHFQRPEAE